jgi:2-polyprenyl-3-methyl-5-hydroxy-6-metoxy-1,4-benzoquinol methylase
MRNCRICSNLPNNRQVIAREMMFGIKDEFRYLECGGCGCLQLIDPPADLSKYYPSNYYSFQKANFDNPLKRYLKRKRGAFALHGRGLIGRLLVRTYGIPAEVSWAKRVGLTFADSVLDVGCGVGQNLLQMSTIGFTALSGVDPYIEQDYQYANGVLISKRRLADVGGAYDFVMFHHSFEHMDEPAGVLEHVHLLLKPDRFALIRMPVAQSHAWKTYGAHWVQLDAPRHLFIYSEKGMRTFADRFGFVLEDVVYDSTGFQFWGSEQYRRDIPLMDKRSVATNPRDSIFTEDELRAFDADAAVLNSRCDGDQACFYLRKRA